MNNDNKTVLTEENLHIESTLLDEKNPDEVSGITVDAKFRIFEPISGKTIIEGKA